MFSAMSLLGSRSEGIPDLHVDILKSHLFGSENHVPNCFWGRLTVTYDANSLYTKDWDSAKLLIVEVSHDLFQCTIRDASADLFEEALTGIFNEPLSQQTNDTLPKLENNIPNESIANHNLRFALQDVTAFYVAYKVQVALGEEMKRLLYLSAPFRRLLPDVEQTHSRVLIVKYLASVDASHYGKLEEMLRPAV